MSPALSTLISLRRGITKLIGIGCERSRSDMMWPSMFLVMVGWVVRQRLADRMLLLCARCHVLTWHLPLVTTTVETPALISGSLSGMC